LEFSGVVKSLGSSATGFNVGDRVYGTGDMLRDGAWAELVAIDHRLVARIPDNLSFADAASLPIGSLTAWEAMFREEDLLPEPVESVLVVGGAGAVGSMAIQLLKARTGAKVIATASRGETREWCVAMGADLVVDHAGDVTVQLKNAGIGTVDMVLSTRSTGEHLRWIASVLRPFGHLSASDVTGVTDLGPLFFKSISIHTEVVFAKGLNGYRVESQSEILRAVAKLAADAKIRPITNRLLHGLNATNMRTAHELIESGRTIGKVVIEF
jgi:NADPH:quinone reductase